MYKVNDYVVYKKDVCKVIEIKEKYFNNTDYYVLVPILDETLKINVPINNNQLRDLITKEEAEELIKEIPSIKVIKTDNKLIENEYRELLNKDSHRDLISIIKTTYLRNKERVDNNKKIGEKDDTYFKLAEKYLYSEFMIVFNMSFEETKNYVIDKVSKIKV